MSTSPDPARLHRLFVRYQDRTLTDAEKAELYQVLAGEPNALAMFRQFCVEAVAASDSRVSVGVSASGSVFRVSLVDEPADRPRSSGSFRRRMTVAAALAAAVLVAVFVARIGYRTGGPVPGTEGGIARITKTVEAVWDESEMTNRPEAALSSGRLVLTSGLARLEFSSGAVAVIEGPIDLQLVSPLRADCHRGKLRAVVPPSAAGFTVGTPGFDVIDRGTEFAVHVADDGEATEVHVFQGRVELSAAGSPSATVVTAGSSQGWKPDGSAAPVIVPPAEFVSLGELNARSLSRYETWSAAAKRLAADPSLLAYFPIDGQPTWDRTLADARPNGTSNGTVVGAAWAEGRWSSKKALSFIGDSDRVSFHVPGEYDSITLTAWVWLDRLDRRYHSLMVSDGVHWQILIDGLVSLGVHLEGKYSEVTGRFLTSPDPSAWRFGSRQTGRWVHLGVVYDGVSGTVCHYADGRQVASERITARHKLQIGDADLGNWTPSPEDPQYRSLRGRIDEFAIYSRPLTSDEFYSRFQAGRP